MIDKEKWKFNKKWLDYVLENWKPNTGRVQQVKEFDEISTEFMEKARSAFKKKGLFHKTIKVWISVQEPNDGEGYEQGYPHVHYPLYANTLVHYLDTGDVDTKLHIFDGDKVIEEVTPKKGMTVFMANDLKHGVLKNKGTKNRIQMIATGLK